MFQARLCPQAPKKAFSSASLGAKCATLRTKPARLHAQAPAKQVKADAAKVVFQLPMHVDFGQSMHIVGSSPVLGSWDAKKALPMTWTENDVWTAELDLLDGSDVQYKYVIRYKRDADKATWMDGDNLAVQLDAAAQSAVVCDSWDKGRQSIKVAPTEGQAEAAIAEVAGATAAAVAEVVPEGLITAPSEPEQVIATPVIADATPAQVTPAVAEVTPSVAEVTPPVAEVTPPVAEVTPPGAEASPEAAGPVETTQEVLAAAEEAEEAEEQSDIPLVEAAAGSDPEKITAEEEEKEKEEESGSDILKGSSASGPALVPAAAAVAAAAEEPMSNIVPGPATTEPAEEKSQQKSGSGFAGLPGMGIPGVGWADKLKGFPKFGMKRE